MRRAFLDGLIWTIVLLITMGRWAAAARAEKIILNDVNGAKVAPLEDRSRKATVFCFVTHDCPISNGYAPEINRICAAYTAQKIAFYIVYVDPDMPSAVGKKHAKEYGYPCPALLDPAHKLVKLTGVTVTPEVAVLAPDGKRLYRGRIDDRAVDFGSVRAQPTMHDLRAALDAILQGKSVPTPTTRAIGCFIPKEKKRP